MKYEFEMTEQEAKDFADSFDQDTLNDKEMVINEVGEFINATIKSSRHTKAIEHIDITEAKIKPKELK